MRAIKTALLWTLGVAAVLVAPTALAPATAAGATQLNRAAAPAGSSGQHTTRTSPALSQRSGATDVAAPVLAAAKAGSSSGFTGSGAPGEGVRDTLIDPPAAALEHAATTAAPRTGADPGARLGRSPPATHRA